MENLCVIHREHYHLRIVRISPFTVQCFPTGNAANSVDDVRRVGPSDKGSVTMDKECRNPYTHDRTVIARNPLPSGWRVAPKSALYSFRSKSPCR